MVNIDKDIPKMTLGRYFSLFLLGLVYWLPFTVIAFTLPIVGWIMIPAVPFFPFFYPFLHQNNAMKRLELLRKKYVDEQAFKNAKK